MGNETMRMYQEKNTYFAMMPNWIAEDMRLKPNSVRLLLYVNGKPPGWVIRRKDIEERLEMSRNTLNNVLINLEENGYLTRRRYQDKSSKWQIDYTFYSDPGKNDNYHGEMPKSYYIVKKTNKKPHQAGEQGRVDNTNETSNNSITHNKNNATRKEKLVDNAGYFEPIDDQHFEF